MSDHKYAVEMPVPPEQKDCEEGQHWYCSHSRTMRYVADVEAMRDKMQDEIDRLRGTVSYLQEQISRFMPPCHIRLPELDDECINQQSKLKGSRTSVAAKHNYALLECRQRQLLASLGREAVLQAELATEREKSAKLTADLTSTAASFDAW